MTIAEINSRDKDSVINKYGLDTERLKEDVTDIAPEKYLYRSAKAEVLPDALDLLNDELNKLK